MVRTSGCSDGSVGALRFGMAHRSTRAHTNEDGCARIRPSPPDPREPVASVVPAGPIALGPASTDNQRQMQQPLRAAAPEPCGRWADAAGRDANRIQRKGRANRGARRRGVKQRKLKIARAVGWRAVFIRRSFL